MNGVFGTLNEIYNAIQPGHSVVGVLWRETRVKSQKNDAERYGLKNRRKIFVKGAVDKDRAVKWWGVQV